MSTAADLTALGALFDAFEHFGDTVSNLFAPVGTFAGL